MFERIKRLFSKKGKVNDEIEQKTFDDDGTEFFRGFLKSKGIQAPEDLSLASVYDKYGFCQQIAKAAEERRKQIAKADEERRKQNANNDTMLSRIELEPTCCGLKKLIENNRVLKEAYEDPKMRHLAYGTIINKMCSEIEKNPYLASIWINFLEGDEPNKITGIKAYIDESEKLKGIWEESEDAAIALAIKEIAGEVKEDPNCAARLVAQLGWNLPSKHNSKCVVLAKKRNNGSLQEGQK